MREDHHELQTPKKEIAPVSSNRKSKSNNAPSKKLHHQQQKSTKTNSISVITPVSEGDVVLNLSEESNEKVSSNSGTADADQSIVDISKLKLNSDRALVFPEESVRSFPLSEAFVFGEDQPSIETYIASLYQHISPSSITLEATPLSSKSPAETSPLSSITTVDMSPSSSTPTITADDAVVHGDTVHDTKSMKLQLVVKHLRDSMSQVLHSDDINPSYKKLLDALVKTVIEEFCSSHEERGFVADLFSKKVKFVLLSYFLGMLLVCAGFLFFSDVQSSYYGPRPT